MRTRARARTDTHVNTAVIHTVACNGCWLFRFVALCLPPSILAAASSANPTIRTDMVAGAWAPRLRGKEKAGEGGRGGVRGAGGEVHLGVRAPGEVRNFARVSAVLEQELWWPVLRLFLRLRQHEPVRVLQLDNTAEVECHGGEPECAMACRCPQAAQMRTDPRARASSSAG